jgi:hypothetical protein
MVGGKHSHTWSQEECEAGDVDQCYCPDSPWISPENCEPYGINCEYGCQYCECERRPCPAACEYAYQFGSTLYMCWLTINPEDVIKGGLDFELEGIDNVEFCYGGIGGDQILEFLNQDPCDITFTDPSTQKPSSSFPPSEAPWNSPTEEPCLSED